MKALICAVALLALTGCGQTTWGSDVSASVKDRGKTAAAAMLENAVWILCRVTPIGAIKDQFMVGSRQWRAYSSICEVPHPAELELPTTK